MRVFALILAILPMAALADDGVRLSDRVIDLRAGLFCAPPEGDRRPAPDTLSGWVHVPDQPVQMIAEGREAPAVLGLGFGVRYLLDTTVPLELRYTVTHPPMPPTGATRQSWVGNVLPGNTDTVFFQFDIEDELQPGPWSFSASANGQALFSVAFTVRPAAELPGLAGLCRDGSLLSVIPSTRAEAG
jgi:hypothetical protein